MPTILAAKLEKQGGSLRRQEEIFVMEAIVLVVWFSDSTCKTLCLILSITKKDLSYGRSFLNFALSTSLKFQEEIAVKKRGRE